MFVVLEFDDDGPGSGGVGVLLSQTVNAVKCNAVDGLGGKFEVFDHEVLDCCFGLVCGWFGNASEDQVVSHAA